MHPVKGTTPLMVAATKKSGVEAVRTLIDLGADLDATDTGKHKCTALHYAAYNNRVAQLELLLDAGADIFALNGKGHTALDVARLRGRKEAASALTSRLQLHSGWLYLRSTSMLSFWKRRWCVLLACNAKHTTTELSVFRSPDKTHPEAVIWQDSTADAMSCSAFSDERANGFQLDTRVVYQRLSCRRYSRYKTSGRTFTLKANMQPREYLFACDTGTNRNAWMQALGRCRSIEPDGSISSTWVETPRPRSRATTTDVLPVTSIASPVGGPDKLLPTHESVETRAPASAPTFIEEDVWGGLPAPDAPVEQGLLPIATVVAISGDPNEVQPLTRDRCIVCREDYRDSVCIPCGHVAGCYGCMQAVTQESSSCPVCRAHVDGVVRINEC